MSTQNNKKKTSKDTSFEDNVLKFFDALIKTLFLIVKELILGIRYGTIPYLSLSLYVAMVIVAFRYGLDFHIWSMLGKAHWYPQSQKLYDFYWYFFVSSPVWLWGACQVFKRRSLENKMDSIFATASLKNSKGITPKPLFDLDMGNGIRLMRVKRGPFPLEKFHKARSFIESGLDAYVDQLCENREKGTLDITYSTTPMPSVVDYSHSYRSNTCFQVGQTRSDEVFGDLTETPHLLVAGQTGGGKSNFVRSLIMNLYLNNESMEFSLIDLKGGLEFQIFENLRRVRVIPSIERAVKELKNVQEELNRRMKLLREKGVKDLDGPAKCCRQKGTWEKTRRCGRSRRDISWWPPCHK